MSLDRTFAPSPAAVTVGLVDGKTQVGHVARFSPSAQDLTLTLARHTGARTTIPGERVAFVGFHRQPGEPPSPPSARRGGLKIHLSGSRTFLVDADSGTPGAVGFYAKPAEPESPFREIFFYGHGV